MDAVRHGRDGQNGTEYVLESDGCDETIINRIRRGEKLACR